MYKTREMSSVALCPLLSSVNVVNVLSHILDQLQLSLSPSTSPTVVCHNLLHGSLLQVTHFTIITFITSRVVRVIDGSLLQVTSEGHRRITSTGDTLYHYHLYHQSCSEGHRYSSLVNFGGKTVLLENMHMKN